MRVLITGANGFVGRALVERLRHAHDLTLVSGPRGVVPPDLADQRWVQRDLTTPGDFAPLVRGQEAIVHLAGLAHVTRRSAGDTWERFDALNVQTTRNLASAASANGVGRFILMSSGAVNGIETPGRPFRETDPANPSSHYGRSKLLAEQTLQEIGLRTGMQWVALRPPVLVGPGAPGNIRTMLRIIKTGVPLPFASINNRRSYLGLRNFSDLVATTLDHPKAANQVFMLTDAPALSTPDLIRELAQGADRTPLIFPTPEVFLRAAAAASGRMSAFRPLWTTLELDPRKAVETLGWERNQPLRDALHETARAFVRAPADAPS